MHHASTKCEYGSVDLLAVLLEDPSDDPAQPEVILPPRQLLQPQSPEGCNLRLPHQKYNV